ncbi:hypothetical protein [Paenisporosarcina sp. TG20]|uniref:hypothetical protein n=1 Tax=Paenisporosarcina sp. TG20 TaxID=1211706 RepID=UPI0002DD7209|nr:hypothetical protein [Paenisporosarcina sp. TG20]
MIKYVSIAIVFVILLGGYFSYTVDQTVEIRASEGELLLQPRDLTDKKIISLDGDWAFYWQQFPTGEELDNSKEAQQYINVPSDWTQTTKESNGYATYSLTVTIPNDQLGNGNLYSSSIYFVFIASKWS